MTTLPNIYLINIKHEDEIEKNIFLQKIDADISKQIVDIETKFAQADNLSNNLLNQMISVIITKAEEKQSAINNNNFELE